jgi:cytochrome c553
MTRSLMFDPAMMGLDAQKIADIAAYIKRLRK